VRGGVGLLVTVLLLTACGVAIPAELPAGAPGAPEACQFDAGTALSYAGRSTTSALGVQEVVGDPMSDEPADIYITRDAFDQGELHGRLVCAVYVNEPGFVEVTVHPADGGRARAEPDPTPEPLGPNEVEIVTHCGLDFARVDFEGQTWKFDVEEQANAPWGWGSNTQVVTLKPGADGPIVIGPDSSVWHLIPADDDDELGICM
jgi:hypothetical protein